MKKYYTASIEEFYIGFEYEAFNNPDWFFSESGSEWVTSEVSLGTSLPIVMEAIEKGWIRVKCLDREDVESLGWECTSRRSFPDKPPVLLFDIIINDKAYGISLRENSTFLEVIERDRRNGNHISNLFQGTKNKSELIKILKQIGV